MSRRWIHASAVVVGEAGVIVLGPSGAGKSTVCRLLLDRAAATGRSSRLIGDDKVSVEASGSRLLVRAHAVTEGKIEVRGFGIETVPHEPAAIVRLIVSLDADVERLPGHGAVYPLAGVETPLLRIRQGDTRAADLILTALGPEIS